MEGVTLWTHPEPDIEREGVKNMPTVGTALGGRIPLVNLDEGASIPLRFIFQLTDKLTPTYVTKGFREVMVLYHVLNRETLDTDHLVLVNNARRELVLIITTTISNASVDTCHTDASLGPILTAFFLLGMAALARGQAFLVFTEELRVADMLPIRGDNQTLQAQIKPYHLVHHGKRLDVLLDEDTDEVTSTAIFGDGNSSRLAFLGQGTTPMNVEGFIHLGKGKLFPVPFEGRADVGRCLWTLLAMEVRVLGTAFKEVLVSSVQMAQGLLNGDSSNLIQPGIFRLLLKGGETSRGLTVVDAFLPLIVGITPQSKCPVVDETRTAEGASKYLLLLVGWVYSILISAFLFHILYCSTYRVEYQGLFARPRHLERRPPVNGLERCLGCHSER